MARLRRSIWMMAAGGWDMANVTAKDVVMAR
jgi:hypothetical protein